MQRNWTSFECAGKVATPNLNTLHNFLINCSPAWVTKHLHNYPSIQSVLCVSYHYKPTLVYIVCLYWYTRRKRYQCEHLGILIIALQNIHVACLFCPEMCYYTALYPVIISELLGGEYSPPKISKSPSKIMIDSCRHPIVIVVQY